MDCILCGEDEGKGVNQPASALKRIKLGSEVVTWQEARVFREILFEEATFWLRLLWQEGGSYPWSWEWKKGPCPWQEE